MRNRNQIISLLLILFAAGAWSSSALFITQILAYSDLTPSNLAFLRELLTFAVYLIGVLVWKPALLRVHKQDLVWLALMGGIGIGLFHVIWNTSVILNGIAISTVLQYNEAVLTSLAAVYFFQEKMHRRKVLGIAGSLLGTALIAGVIELDAGSITSIGLLVGLASAAFHTCFHLFGKKLSGSYPPITIMLYAFGFGTLVLLPLQFFGPLPSDVPPAAVTNLILLVLVPTVVGYAAFGAGLRGLPVSTANIIAISEVPIAALLGYIFLGEVLSPWQSLGAVLVVTSVVLVSLGRRRTAPVTERVPAGS